jgi:hypothetical protein
MGTSEAGLEFMGKRSIHASAGIRSPLPNTQLITVLNELTNLMTYVIQNVLSLNE